jgi:hypothetical protein
MKTLFIVHLYRDLGAHEGAHHAGVAFVIFSRFRVMVSHLIQVVGTPEGVSFTEPDAEIAALAHLRFNDYPALFRFFQDRYPVSLN